MVADRLVDASQDVPGERRISIVLENQARIAQTRKLLDAGDTGTSADVATEVLVLAAEIDEAVQHESQGAGGAAGVRILLRQRNADRVDASRRCVRNRRRRVQQVGFTILGAQIVQREFGAETPKIITNIPADIETGEIGVGDRVFDRGRTIGSGDVQALLLQQVNTRFQTNIPSLVLRSSRARKRGGGEGEADRKLAHRLPLLCRTSPILASRKSLSQALAGMQVWIG